jgi:predicted permease
MPEIQQDLRYAFRNLLRHRLLSCAVISTLVIGIGLNAAMFSVVNGMVFRARVSRSPQSFLQLFFDPGSNTGKASLATYRNLQTARSVENLEAWTVVHTTIADDPSDNLAMLVTCRFFALYDLDRPKLGRLFEPGDCESPASAPVAVIGEELWKRTFSSAPNIIGRQVLLNHHPYKIVGVVPAGFEGRLRGGGIWIPYTNQRDFFTGGADLFGAAAIPWLTVEGRIAPGHTRSEAVAELSSLAGPAISVNATDGSLIQLPSSLAAVKWIVPLLLSAFALILLLACANVVMLLLSRAVSRQREMAIRVSLGANRRRLVQMLLTEGLLLAAIAGVLSACLSFGVPALFERVMWRAPHYIVQPDWMVFAYLAALTLLAGIVTGLVPAYQSFKLDLIPTMKGRSPSIGKGPTRWTIRDLLIAAQVSASLVLLIGAALFARAEFSMLNLDPGFSTRNVLLVPWKSNAPIPKALEQRILSLAGVRSLCYTSIAPFAGKTPRSIAFSSGCFETLGIPLQRGQANLQGNSAVVSSALANKAWPGQNPIGKSIAGFQVSGVARDLAYIHPGSLDGPTIYQSRQLESSADALLVRFDGDPVSLAHDISHAMLDMDLHQTAVPYTLSSQIAEMASRFAVIEGTIVVLGLVALVLAVVGIYGVVGFAVLRRTKELGIRLALGATTYHLVRPVVGSGLRPVLIGATAGSALAIAGSASLQQVFHNTPVSIDPFDPLPYVAVSALLIATAATAMLLPALKAAYGIPAVALRED